MFSMIIDCFSQIGPRDKNEAFIIVDEPKFVFVVCDGMGGHDGGEIASKTVAETIVNHWSNDMDEVCQNAAAKLDEVAGDIDMGTTMALVALSDTHAKMAHCGDSRIYLVREGKLVYQSVDHIALTDSGTPILTRGFFSHKHRFTPDIHEEKIISGDRILICTDGVFGNGKWSDLRDLLVNKATTIEDIEELASRNAHDNYSAILINIV